MKEHRDRHIVRHTYRQTESTTKNNRLLGSESIIIVSLLQNTKSGDEHGR